MDVVPFSKPAQLSVAVGALKTVIEQVAIRSGKLTEDATGLVLSLITTD